MKMPEIDVNSRSISVVVGAWPLRMLTQPLRSFSDSSWLEAPTHAGMTLRWPTRRPQTLLEV